MFYLLCDHPECTCQDINGFEKQPSFCEFTCIGHISSFIFYQILHTLFFHALTYQSSNVNNAAVFLTNLDVISLSGFVSSFDWLMPVIQ